LVSDEHELRFIELFVSSDSEDSCSRELRFFERSDLFLIVLLHDAELSFFDLSQESAKDKLCHFEETVLFELDLQFEEAIVLELVPWTSVDLHTVEELLSSDRV
jgi:hypothetical protein